MFQTRVVLNCMSLDFTVNARSCVHGWSSKTAFWHCNPLPNPITEWQYSVLPCSNLTVVWTWFVICSPFVFSFYKYFPMFTGFEFCLALPAKPQDSGFHWNSTSSNTYLGNGGIVFVVWYSFPLHNGLHSILYNVKWWASLCLVNV